MNPNLIPLKSIAIASMLACSTLSFAGPSTPMKLGTNLLFGGWENAFQSNVNWSTTTDPWDPAWKSDISIYGVIRTLDMSATNWNPDRTWAGRTQPTDSKNQSAGEWQGHPLAWEWLIDIANKSGSDLWINVPHHVGQEYWTSLAQLVFQKLNPNLKVYVEFSNEIWNGTFATQSWGGNEGQFTYCDAEGAKLVNSWTDRNVAAFAVKQSSGIWKAFEDAFGIQKDRVINTIGARHDISSYIDYVEEYMKRSDLNTYGMKVEGYATAPYFGLRWGVNLDFCSGGIDLLEDEMWFELGRIKDSYDKAKAAGALFLGYEGGQQIYNSCPDAVNRNAKIYDLYTTYFNEVNKYYDVFNHYGNISPYGSQYAWGAKEYAGQPESQAHKYRAIHDWIKAHPGSGPGPVTPPTPTAPSISTQPANVSVEEGASATFSVSATGNPTPTYQWKKNGANISGATSASYTTPSLALSDNGTKYSVVVTNSQGTKTSTEATLTVTAYNGYTIPEWSGSWSSSNWQAVDNLVVGTAPANVADLGVKFQSAWDASGLRVRVQVQDQASGTGTGESYQGDNVEVYVDPQGNAGGSYDAQDEQIRWVRATGAIENMNGHTGITATSSNINGGYEVIFTIPWSSLGATAALGQRIGLELQVTDNDGAASRESKVAWHGATDNAWQSPANFGKGRLSEKETGPVRLIATPKGLQIRNGLKTYNLMGRVIQ
jgi:hypothetical protein